MRLLHTAEEKMDKAKGHAEDLADPRWTVGGTPDQSVTLNGSVGIFMRSQLAIIERYVGCWKPYATKRILLIEAGP